MRVRGHFFTWCKTSYKNKDDIWMPSSKKHYRLNELVDPSA